VWSRPRGRTPLALFASRAAVAPHHSIQGVDGNGDGPVDVWHRRPTSISQTGRLHPPGVGLEPEEEARKEIDSSLARAGWIVQDRKEANIYTGRGVAIREVSLKRGHGEADYLLYIDGKAAGAIEAKPVGTTLTGVERQSEKYADGMRDKIPSHDSSLTFLYESTGVETRFSDRWDPDPRSRVVTTFHAPESLARWLRLAEESTLRGRLRQLPPLPEGGLWPIQVRAARSLEASLAQDRPRALI
jgi:type I restriction enzyme R subunit